MSLTYHDQIFLAPLAGNPKSGRHPRRADKSRESGMSGADDPHGIGRSPRFAPGWWLVGTALFYVAIALLCIFVL